MTTLFITGANRGIGLELAKQALAKGWTVYGSSRHAMSASDADITTHPQFHNIVFDVRDHAAVKAAAAAITVPIDVVINNAGIIGPDNQTSDNMDFEGFAETLAINTLAPLAVSQVFLPHLKRSKNPRVVMISSSMGSLSYAHSDRLAYRASKAALNKVMQGLATDLKSEGISVISVHPGWVQTDMGGAEADITPQKSAENILKLIDGLNLKMSGKFFNWDGSSAAF